MVSVDGRHHVYLLAVTAAQIYGPGLCNGRRTRIFFLLPSIKSPPPPPPLSLSLSHTHIHTHTHSSGAVWTGRWALALLPCPILPPSLCGRKAPSKKKGVFLWLDCSCALSLPVCLSICLCLCLSLSLSPPPPPRPPFNNILAVWSLVQNAMRWTAVTCRNQRLLISFQYAYLPATKTVHARWAKQTMQNKQWNTSRFGPLQFSHLKVLIFRLSSVNVQ